jgi:membrane associated rhomboid family serine protease
MRYNFRGSKTIWTLIGVNVFVFIITTASPSIGDSLALTNPITGSNYWTIVTAMFVHANFLHILFNMLALYFFGTFCLQLIDTKRFLAVYFIGGVVGNILFLLLGPMYSSVVGASGAIYAIGGILVMMRPTMRVYLYFLIPMPLWVVIIFGFLLTAFNGGTAWQAHLGGLIVGLAAGYFFRQRERRQRLPPVYYRW